MNETVHPRSPTTGLVGFLFGVGGTDELPGGALVELLGEFGLTPAAARQQLTRMRSAGQLTSTRAGRGSTYRLAGPFGVMVRALRVDRGAAPEWPGHFHALLHQVPESARAYRDRLRRAASLVGYGSLQPGVLIAVGDRRERLTDVLADAPADARVRAAELGLGVTDAREVAREAWGLDDLARDLRGHLLTLEPAVGRHEDPSPTAATLRGLAATTNQVTVDLLRDPGLPVELWPEGWPGDDVRVALGALARRYAPAAAEYVHTRAAAHRG